MANHNNRVVSKVYWAFLMNGNALEFYRENVPNGSNFVDLITSNNSILMGQWQHVAFVTDGSNTASNSRVYINGLESSYSSTQNGIGAFRDDSGNNFLIGTADGDTFAFDGLLDDIRIYNRILSNDEIKRLYNMGR